MYKLAQGLVRHKVGVVAVIAFSVFVFSGNGQDEAEAPSSPWAQGASVKTASSASNDASFTGKLGAMATTAGDYVAEKALGDKDLNPIKMGEETVGRFDDSAAAFKKANGG